MKRYLLIDDEEIFNFIQSEVITNRDASDEVTTFNSALDGLSFLKECLDQNKELPDFIFLDVRMPEMNGFEFLEEVNKLTSDRINQIKVYMLSSSLDERDHQRAMSFSLVKGFKSKPLSDEIIDEINH